MRFLASKKNIQNLLYATLFLLPLHPYVFYVTLLPCLLLWAVNHCTTGEVKCVRPRLWGLPAVFLACAFFSGFSSPAPAFSLMNWAFQPLMYAAIYLLILSLLSSVREKEKALYAFLAGAICVAAYGFIQYANVAGMAADMTAQSWVDPERFPLLRRRMYSTLENPNLLGAYAVMIISILTAFFLRERQKKGNGLLPSFSSSCFSALL